MHNSMPPASGLYDPRFEHDACGVSFVVDVQGRKSHNIVAMGIGALCRMEHRGATGAEVETGDGAGVLIQVPHKFLSEVASFPLPTEGHYGVGMAFLPADADSRSQAVVAIEKIVQGEGLEVLGWREVPVNPDCLGESARRVMPYFSLMFVRATNAASGIDLDRLLFIARKRIEHELPEQQQTYFPSLSARTLIYKGMLTTPELAQFFPDLIDERMESSMALVHSRFSTNTFPSWPLAHPYRYIAHNGEINTVQGNRNWMRTRESMLSSDLLPGLERAFPICAMGGSDSASFDEVLESLSALYSEPHEFSTVVIDSVDWLEPLVWAKACRDNGWGSIEDAGYGKGYVAALGLWRQYIEGLNALRDDRGMTVVQIAHTEIKRFDSPEHDPYDRYVIKLHSRAAALLQEHSDIVLFANYRISTVKSDVGFNKKISRAVGSGERVIHTAERPAYLAKNRYGLPDTLPLEWQAFATAMPVAIQSMLLPS